MFGTNNTNPFMMNSQTGTIDIENNKGTIDIEFEQEPTFYGGQSQFNTMYPIIEPVKERVVNRTFEYVVPHICPIRTKVINHHVYKHTYQPDYSCQEENVCSEIQCGSCCNFN